MPTALNILIALVAAINLRLIAPVLLVLIGIDAASPHSARAR
jgi:hypothetical protein